MQGVRLAQKFESLVLSDERFEIPAKRHLGMVVFRLAGENDLTEKLLKKLNGSGNLFGLTATPGSLIILYMILLPTQPSNCNRSLYDL